MKGNHIKKVLISAATIAACSILTALPVYADDTYSDDVWAYRAVANVVEAVISARPLLRTARSSAI